MSIKTGALKFDPQVGDKVHTCFYSDVHPGTVVKRTAKRCTVRFDDVAKDPSWEPEFVPGGFAGHCVNQEDQRWIIADNPDGVIHRFFLHKSGQWRMSAAGGNESGRGPRLGPGWAYKRDFNF
jgi:hypothetical protein